MSDKFVHRIIVTACVTWAIILYQVIAIVLKLNGAIAWEWWQVLFPLIAYAALWAGVLIATIAFGLVMLPEIYSHIYEE